MFANAQLPELRPADRRPVVKIWLQFLLNEGHHDEGKLVADEHFGLHAMTATRAWQKSTGLEETGQVGDIDWSYATSEVRQAARQAVAEEATKNRRTKPPSFR